MKQKEFNNTNNPYATYTPVPEQIESWLDNHPEIQLDNIKVEHDKTFVNYRELQP